jgi:peptide/nickel transport system ATP-binding protein
VSSDLVLDGRGVTVAFQGADGPRVVVGEVDLPLPRGRTVGLAGESGCGKSTLALTLTGFRIDGSQRLAGEVEFGGIDLFALDERALSRLWGQRIAYLPQNAATALDPRLRIETQMTEPLRLHRGLSARAARARAAELLEHVGLPEPKAALRRFAHQFSGGQQQRIALAMAIACQPEILILDEPTTGLDVTTQARINRLIVALVAEFGLSTLYISHNLALLSEVCDELAIMYAGQIVERGLASDVCRTPAHPYTQRLLDAVPSTTSSLIPVGIPGLPPARVEEGRCAFGARCAAHLQACDVPVALVATGADRVVRCVRASELATTPRATKQVAPRRRQGQGCLLEVEGLSFRHHQSSSGGFDLGPLDLSLAEGEILGIAGESGSGKTTLLRCAAGLLRPLSGTMTLRNVVLAGAARHREPEVRRRIQLIFQNPDASLNPRHTIGDIVERPIALLRPDVSRSERRALVRSLVASVQLPEDVLARRPRQLSGGQRQRIAIARALAADPDVLLCDEITSALDVSIQASILELLLELCGNRRAMAVIFVTHDLGVLRSISDRVVIMRNGRVVEQGATDSLFAKPREDYTRELLAAVPTLPQRSGAANDCDLGESSHTGRSSAAVHRAV